MSRQTKKLPKPRTPEEYGLYLAYVQREQDLVVS